jgi:hypothetical protein
MHFPHSTVIMEGLDVLDSMCVGKEPLPMWGGVSASPLFVWRRLCVHCSGTPCTRDRSTIARLDLSPTRAVRS